MPEERRRGLVQKLDRFFCSLGGREEGAKVIPLQVHPCHFRPKEVMKLPQRRWHGGELRSPHLLGSKVPSHVPNSSLVKAWGYLFHGKRRQKIITRHKGPP